MSQRKVTDAFVLALILGATAEILYLGIQVRRARAELVARNPPDILVGRQVYPLRAVDSTGEAFSIRTDRPRLLFYFSPDCGVCRENAPNWATISEVIGSQNIIAVAAPAPHSRARGDPSAYLHDHQIHCERAVVLPEGEVVRLDLHQVPRTILTDRNGKAAAVWRGLANPSLVTAKWKEILKKGG